MKLSGIDLLTKELDKEVASSSTLEQALASSQASYRLWIESGRKLRWSTTSPPDDHDYEVAKKIKQYYLNQLGFKGLTSTMTPYQLDLYGILTKAIPLTTRHTGMIMRLPYFYVEDQKRLKLKDIHNKQLLTGLAHQPNVLLDLEYIDTVFKGRRSNEIYEFWFKNRGGTLYSLFVSSSNPLLCLIESLVRVSWLTVTADVYPKTDRYNNYDFYLISNIRQV